MKAVDRWWQGWRSGGDGEGGGVGSGSEMNNINPFPFLVISRICAASPAPPRAAADRSHGTINHG